MLQGVSELANIAGPIVGFEAAETFGRQARCRLAEVPEKVQRQFSHVLGASAQGRRVQGDDIQAMVKVGRKEAIFHLLGEITIRRCDDADVHPHRFVAPTRPTSRS